LTFIFKERLLRIVIITQDDPFFLPDALPRLFSAIGEKHDIVGSVLLSATPYGKRESFVSKSLKTHRIFGTVFFLRYALKFIFNKIFSPGAMERNFRRRGIPILFLNQSINSKSSLDRIAALEPDVLVSIAGNEIFKTPLLNLAPKGCLNVHTALLPKYRGLMPSFWVLKHKEQRTGVSVFLVDEGIDSGPIVVQKSLEIGEMSQEELIRKTKILGMEAVAEALDIIDTPSPDFIENSDDKMSYFGFPTSDDVREFRKNGARFF
jgi:methionyl-tRNA formyltransferase